MYLILNSDEDEEIISHKGAKTGWFSSKIFYLRKCSVACMKPYIDIYKNIWNNYPILLI